MKKRFSCWGSYTSFKPFILKVNSGAGSNYVLRTNTASYTYNYSLRSSDGQFFASQTGDLTITFPSANTDYTIEISGIFPAIYINGTAITIDKTLEIKQYGDVVFSSFAAAFYLCSNLISTATDVPKIAAGCSFYRAFMGTQVNPSNIKLF